MSSLITVQGNQVRVHGRFLRMARLEADKYHFLEDPEALLTELKSCGTRIDLFTFIQKLSDTSKKYAFPMEWDNFAALPVSTFDNWWNQQIGFKARNKAKQAQKKGVVIREVPFDRELVSGKSTTSVQSDKANDSPITVKISRLFIRKKPAFWKAAFLSERFWMIA
jgi:hypothetical protein